MEALLHPREEGLGVIRGVPRLVPNILPLPRRPRPLGEGPAVCREGVGRPELLIHRERPLLEGSRVRAGPLRRPPEHVTLLLETDGGIPLLLPPPRLAVTLIAAGLWLSCVATRRFTPTVER